MISPHHCSKVMKQHCGYVSLCSNDQKDGGIFGNIIRKCRKIREKMLLKVSNSKVSPSSNTKYSTAKLQNSNIKDNSSKDDPKSQHKNSSNVKDSSKDDPKSQNTRKIERSNGHFIRTIYYGWLLERTSRNSSNYQLRNPTSCRVLDLPRAKEKEWRRMLPVYLPSRKTFKMVFPYPNHKNGHFCFKVLTIGLDKKWRKLDFPSACKLTNAKLVTRIFFDHLLVTAVLPETSKGNNNAAAIVCFEAESEKLWSINVPKDFTLNGGNNIALVNWDRKLALARKLENDVLYVWVVEDYKTQKWAEERIMVDLTYIKNDDRKYYRPRSFCKGKLRMSRNLESCLSFDIASKVVKYFDEPKEKGLEISSRYLEDLEGSKPYKE